MATKLKVNYEFVGDSTTPVTRTESIKHGDSMLNTVINAAAATVNTKADKSYVDTELAKKANAADVTTALSGKADNTTVSALDSRVGTAETNIATQTARIDEIASLPEGSTTGDAELIDIRVGADGKTYTSAGNAVRGQISDVKSDLRRIENTDNLLLNSIKHDGKYYYTSETDSEDYCYFEIPVQNGNEYVIAKGARFLSKNGENIVNDVMVDYHYTADFTGKIYVSYSYTQGNPWIVCLSGKSLDEIGGYNTPSLSKDIISQELGSSKTKVISQKFVTDNINSINTTIDNLKIITVKGKNSIVLSKDSLNGTLYTASMGVKTDYNYIAAFEASNIMDVRIGRGRTSSEIFSSYLRITPRKWSVYVNFSEQTVLREMDTDLKPQYYIIYIKVSNNHKATIKIAYPGDSYVFDNIPWNGDGANNSFIESIDAAITNVNFTYQLRDGNKNIAMFGDSYFHIDDNSTWMYHYVSEYDNALVSGFGGAKTKDAYYALDSMILVSKPRYAVLCTGMNDGSDSGDTPNSEWTTWKDYFISKCKANGITPILATIPTVPTINHDAKNLWVRNSGYRYIDFAEAVGSRNNGIWYENMLGNDGIHPTTRGACALFYRAITDIPELAEDD